MLASFSTCDRCASGFVLARLCVSVLPVRSPAPPAPPPTSDAPAAAEPRIWASLARQVCVHVWFLLSCRYGALIFLIAPEWSCLLSQLRCGGERCRTRKSPSSPFSKVPFGGAGTFTSQPPELSFHRPKRERCPRCPRYRLAPRPCRHRPPPCLCDSDPSGDLAEAEPWSHWLTSLSATSSSCIRAAAGSKPHSFEMTAGQSIVSDATCGRPHIRGGARGLCAPSGSIRLLEARRYAAGTRGSL